MLLQQVLQGLMEGVTLFLIASGLTLIFGVSRIVNFAHGSFYMLGAFLTFQLHGRLWAGSVGGFLLTIVASALVVAALGVLFEFFVLRRVYRSEELMQLVITVGLVLIVEDAVRFIWGQDDVTVPVPAALQGALVVKGTYFPLYQLAIVLVGIAVLGAMWLALRYTRAGIILRAATDDRGMVALLGINQATVFTAVFAVGSFLAGLAGGLAAAFESVNFLLDSRIIVAAFIVVVIGGLGNLYGALLGALAVGVVKALGLLWAPRLSMVLIFLVMAAVLMTRTLRRGTE
jgi:branched-subunit amino acid ABC-type transport system permease component